MSKLSVTDFSNRTGSPYQNKTQDKPIINEDAFERIYEKQKEKQCELTALVNKKTAERKASKSPDGFFTEIVTHGAFTNKNDVVAKPKGNTKTPLLGYPSSANDLALDAKTDLESDKNISEETKTKVIDKLFTLVSMVQHAYEAKVRMMTELEKFKEIHLRNEVRREREHSEQLYRLNLNYQAEVVQVLQQLRSELDISSCLKTDDGHELKINGDINE